MSDAERIGAKNRTTDRLTDRPTDQPIDRLSDCTNERANDQKHVTTKIEHIIAPVPHNNDVRFFVFEEWALVCLSCCCC